MNANKYDIHNPSEQAEEIPLEIVDKEHPTAKTYRVRFSIDVTAIVTVSEGEDPVEVATQGCVAHTTDERIHQPLTYEYNLSRGTADPV